MFPLFPLVFPCMPCISLYFQVGSGCYTAIMFLLFPVTVLLRGGFPQEPNSGKVSFAIFNIINMIRHTQLHGCIKKLDCRVAYFNRCAFFTPLQKPTWQAQTRTSKAFSCSSTSAEAQSYSSMSSTSSSKSEDISQDSARGVRCRVLANTKGTFSTSQRQWSLHWRGAPFLYSVSLFCSPMPTWMNKSVRNMCSTLTPFCGPSFPTCSTPTSTWDSNE